MASPAASLHTPTSPSSGLQPKSRVVRWHADTSISSASNCCCCCCSSTLTPSLPIACRLSGNAAAATGSPDGTAAGDSSGCPGTVPGLGELVLRSLQLPEATAAPPARGCALGWPASTAAVPMRWRMLPAADPGIEPPDVVMCCSCCLEEGNGLAAEALVAALALRWPEARAASVAGPALPATLLLRLAACWGG
eukprot:158253-Pelagomonas_calceolata.AAC.3